MLNEFSHYNLLTAVWSVEGRVCKGRYTRTVREGVYGPYTSRVRVCIGLKTNAKITALVNCIGL